MPMTPEEQDFIKKYLQSQQYSSPEGTFRAQESADRSALMGAIGSGLNTISRAAGAQNLSDEPYQQMATSGQQAVNQESARQKSVRDYLANKAELGMKKTGMDLQIEQLRNQLKHQNDLVGLKKDEMALDRSKVATKLAEDAQKKETPFGVAKTEDDAKKLKDAAASYDSYTKKLDRLYELRKKHGYEMYGPVRAEMESLIKGATLDIKNMEGLGALSSSDLDIVNQQLGGVASDIFGDSSILNRISTTRKSADEKMRSYAKSYGGSADKVITKPSYETQAPGWSQEEEKRLLELEAKAKGKK